MALSVGNRLTKGVEKMIGYVCLGTDNIERARKFYDELLAEVGAKRLMSDGDRMTLWGTGEGPMLGAFRPADGKPATVGNGVMVALATKDKDQVAAIYNKALELGGTDEGPVGPRGDTGFYGGYFRDLDGNKLCAFHFG